MLASTSNPPGSRCVERNVDPAFRPSQGVGLEANEFRKNSEGRRAQAAMPQPVAPTGECRRLQMLGVRPLMLHVTRHNFASPDRAVRRHRTDMTRIGHTNGPNEGIVRFTISRLARAAAFTIDDLASRYAQVPPHGSRARRWGSPLGKSRSMALRRARVGCSGLE